MVMSKPNSPTDQKPYEAVVNKELTADEIAQLDHNLVRFIELLIKLDKQQKQAKEINQV